MADDRARRSLYLDCCLFGVGAVASSSLRLSWGLGCASAAIPSFGICSKQFNAILDKVIYLEFAWTLFLLAVEHALRLWAV